MSRARKIRDAEERVAFWARILEALERPKVAEKIISARKTAAEAELSRLRAGEKRWSLKERKALIAKLEEGT